jgi:hypothetical protein
LITTACGVHAEPSKVYVILGKLYAVSTCGYATGVLFRHKKQKSRFSQKYGLIWSTRFTNREQRACGGKDWDHGGWV